MGDELADRPADEAIPDELVVTLKKPVTFATITYDQLVLREPTAKEWTEWAKLTDVEADIKAVSVIAAVPVQVVEQIGASDLLIASRYIARFLR